MGKYLLTLLVTEIIVAIFALVVFGGIKSMIISCVGTLLLNIPGFIRVIRRNRA